MSIVRGLGIEVNLDGNGDEELRAWIKDLAEARGGADSFAGSLNDMEKEMIDTAKSLGISRDQLKDVIAQTRHGAAVQDFSRRYGVSMNEIKRQSEMAASGAGRLGSVLQAVAGAGVMQRIGSFGADAVRLAAQYEQTSVSFEVMLGSADAARNVLRDLNNFSLTTPFEPEEVTRAGRSLMAFGVQAEDLTGMMRTVGDVASGVGMDFNELAQIMGKNMAQGRVQTEDLMQLAGRGIPIYREMARVFNTSEDQIRNLASSGQIQFSHLQQAFQNMTSQGGQYFGMMDRQSRTTAGLWSTLTGNVTVMKRGIGTMIMEALRPFLELLVRFTGAIAQSETAMTILKIAFALIIPIIGVLLVGAMKAAIVMAWNMAVAVLAATWPFALIAGAIVFLILVIEDLYTWLTGGESVIGAWFGPFAEVGGKIKAIFTGIWDSIKKTFSGIIDWFRSRGRYFIMAIFPVSILYFYWNQISAFFRELPGKIVDFFRSIPDQLLSALSGMGSRIREALRGILPDWAIRLIARVSGEQVQARASGGPVESGRPYIVGEEGPELFVPRGSGNIIPNGAAVGGGRGGSAVITIAPVINFNAPVSRDTADSLVRQIEEAINRVVASNITSIRAGLGLEVG